METLNNVSEVNIKKANKALSDKNVATSEVKEVMVPVVEPVIITSLEPESVKYDDARICAYLKGDSLFLTTKDSSAHVSCVELGESGSLIGCNINSTYFKDGEFCVLDKNMEFVSGNKEECHMVLESLHNIKNALETAHGSGNSCPGVDCSTLYSACVGNTDHPLFDNALSCASFISCC